MPAPLCKKKLVQKLFVILFSISVPLSVLCFTSQQNQVSRARLKEDQNSRLWRNPRHPYPKCSNLEARKLDSRNHVHEGPASKDAEDPSRRRAIFQSLALASVMVPAAPALAGKAEVDKVTGLLYSPKKEMLSGGSAAARGINLDSARTQTTRLKPGQAVQTIYETRFITYLSRFLLNYDPSAKAWWVKNSGLGDTWDLNTNVAKVEQAFAEFAESVEIGLADYFVGPYGSYSSLQAAKAGISASRQVKSSRANDPQGILDWMGDFFLGRKEKESNVQDRDRIAKEGVLNLYTLLKARYTSPSAKRQLAILFTFFANSELQPTAEIKSLLGEADNLTVSDINLIKQAISSEATSRSSCRRGGGYDLKNPPTIVIEPPPALGSSFVCAKANPVMTLTSRVLRIRVTDGGEGYIDPPEVYVASQVGQRPCAAGAILDREGHVESVLVLDPGYGYGRSNKGEAPKVKIAPPPDYKKKGSNNNQFPLLRKATAVADLEYEIVDIDLVEGGNGYVATEPPRVSITLPEEDPDWFVKSSALAAVQSEFGPFRAEISQMKTPGGNSAYSMGLSRPPVEISLDRIKNDPIELLPSSLRPELNSLGCYIIPPIAAFPTYSSSPNPRYRAVDPLFGPIGAIPVTKSALELKPGEYARLALSGAVCTVLVRTALNPLELIKTKQQLQNDDELLSFVKEDKKKATKNSESQQDDTLPKQTEEKIGSLDLILGTVNLRGWPALFQSADITLLASLVFGSFGFGATELFRRSFTMSFFSEDSGELRSVLILLLAATIATIITSAAAAPFELLRVRSMGLVEPKKWTAVLGDFIEEKSLDKEESKKNEGDTMVPAFNLKDVNPKDLLPLWAGFPPTASRELAFAIPKFLAFDLISNAIVGFINSQAGPGSLPIQVGIGTAGLLISAISGAVAGIAGALVSHPADLILTYTSASKKKGDAGADWKEVVKDLLNKEGGIANLFVGLTPRLIFFFLVIGLQFFLYDYVKTILQVGSDDLSLVLDVFYAVRQGLIENLDQLM